MHAGYYIAILSFILVAGAVYVSSWNENQRLAAIESNHPPVVNITREGDGVRIRWYGMGHLVHRPYPRDLQEHDTDIQRLCKTKTWALYLLPVCSTQLHNHGPRV